MDNNRCRKRLKTPEGNSGSTFMASTANHPDLTGAFYAGSFRE